MSNPDETTTLYTESDVQRLVDERVRSMTRDTRDPAATTASAVDIEATARRAAAEYLRQQQAAPHPATAPSTTVPSHDAHLMRRWDERTLSDWQMRQGYDFSRPFAQRNRAILAKIADQVYGEMQSLRVRGTKG